MRYLKFRIKNFKGIKDTTLDLKTKTNTNVFSLVGLNESGKTTVLEAIHSFSPDHRTGLLRAAHNKTSSIPAKERLPRHLLASFTGDISVEATVQLDQHDKESIKEYLLTEYSLIVSKEGIPSELTLKRHDRFNRGDYVKTVYELDFNINGRNNSQRKERALTSTEMEKVYDAIWAHTPDIAYYDSFIFDFPTRIYITKRHGSNDTVYRTMFEDVLAAGKIPYTLEDLRKRIRSDQYRAPWADFASLWNVKDDKARVKQIIDQASETITRTVFGKWNRIFGEDVGEKEIAVESGIEKGRLYNRESGQYVDADEHDLYVTIEIKDGTNRFPIQERSLGFRWFFAFLLFTQFRTLRGKGRPVLFLFDEPAANLHSAAQERLIESFPEIATGDNMLVYSTHSHYMISPDWLEQTFIVTNAADAPATSVLESAVVDDESLDVRVHRYRTFANEHPNSTSYFQPIIDRLEIRPSRFDISLPSVILEGKSDYYIIRYMQMLTGDDNVRLVPGLGAGTFSALVSLGAVWGTKFLFLLDSDSEGNKERDLYALERGARVEAVVSLSDLDSLLVEIEDVLDEEAKAIIRQYLQRDRLSKKDICRYFQEQLAKRNIVPLGNNFQVRSIELLSWLSKRLEAL